MNLQLLNLVAMSSGEAAGGLVAGVLGILFLIFLFLIGTLFYFLPTIIALLRRHPSGLLNRLHCVELLGREKIAIFSPPSETPNGGWTDE